MLAGVALGEDVVLSDKRTFLDASIGALDKDGCVLISGKDTSGVSYCARVPLSKLPADIQARIGEGRKTLVQDEIEFGKTEVANLSVDANEVIFSWKIRVKNTTAVPRRLKLTFEIFDQCRFEIGSGTPKVESLGAFQTETFTGTCSVKPKIAQEAAFKQVKVEW